jgi:hypothetical protein
VCQRASHPENFHRVGYYNPLKIYKRVKIIKNWFKQVIT